MSKINPVARLAVLLGLVASVATAQEPDPFAWLEEIDGARALAWVRAQNAATAKKLEGQPLYQQLHADALAALNSASRLPVVDQRGQWLYNFWKDAQHPRGLYRRATLQEFRRPQPAWQTVL